MDINMKIKDLVKFGMTKTEAKIYLELIKLDETKIGEIIKKTGLHRGTVYNSINKLINKGFVTFIDKEDHRFYKVSGKMIFLNVIEDKLKEVSSNKKEVESFFQNMEKLKENNQNQQINVSYGLNAFKVNFLDMYKECKEKKMEYLFMGKGGEMVKIVGTGYYKYTQDLKKESKIKCRIIISKESRLLSYRKYQVGNARYLPIKVHSPLNLWIYGDKMLLVIWDSKPLITIRIISQQLADGFRNYFEGLWELSEKEQKYLESRQRLFNFNEFIGQAQESLDIFDICCMEPVHEGKDTILRLLKQGKKVRILMADKFSENFKRRVKLEEQYIKNLNESRILYEMKSAIANIKDIKARLKKKVNLEIRITDKKPIYTIVILDNKKGLYNKYGTEKGKYGSTQPTYIYEKEFDREFKIPIKIFEEYWNNAKPLKL